MKIKLGISLLVLLLLSGCSNTDDGINILIESADALETVESTQMHLVYTMSLEATIDDSVITINESIDENITIVNTTNQLQLEGLSASLIIGNLKNDYYGAIVDNGLEYRYDGVNWNPSTEPKYTLALNSYVDIFGTLSDEEVEALFEKDAPKIVEEETRDGREVIVVEASYPSEEIMKMLPLFQGEIEILDFYDVVVTYIIDKETKLPIQVMYDFRELKTGIFMDRLGIEVTPEQLPSNNYNIIIDYEQFNHLSEIELPSNLIE